MRTGIDEFVRIDHKVPMPPIGKGKRKYPWRRLEVGDSFLVECCTWELKDKFNSITSCRKYATYKTGRKFAMRAVEGGIRVWRTF